MLNTEVLVLNKGFQPVNVIDVKRGFAMLYSGIAKALDDEYQMFDFDSWTTLSDALHENMIGTPRGHLRIPRVLVLQLYNRMPMGRIRFSRRNIMARDKYTCQYCNASGSKVTLNMDHVIPRAQGGTTQWENVVTSCVPCNTRKGAKTPRQAGMRLKTEPRKPNWSELTRVPIQGRLYPEWAPFLSPVDASYWNAELLKE